MKYVAFLLAGLFLITGAWAQAPAKAGALKYKTEKHNFGKVPQNKPVTYKFSFVNSSSKPVIIQDAVAECGCTKPTYPQKPVMPGKAGEISVTYDAKAKGSFTKKVTVTLVNDTNPKVLEISGEVI